MTEPPQNGPTRQDEPPAVQVRQGITPGIVRYVLAVSLVLVVIGFALSWLFA